MPRARYCWIEPRKSLQGCEAEMDLTAESLDSFTPSDGDFPGPEGTYTLLTEERWRIMNLEEPLPVFLHEACAEYLEKWTFSISDPADEIAAVAEVRDAVIALVDSRLAKHPEWFPASSTVTSTENTARGLEVVGRCLLIGPAQAWA